MRSHPIIHPRLGKKEPIGTACLVMVILGQSVIFILSTFTDRVRRGSHN
jgi:hypothetical protein